MDSVQLWFIITAVVNLDLKSKSDQFHLTRALMTTLPLLILFVHLVSLFLPLSPSRELQPIVSSAVSPVLSKVWTPRITSRLVLTHIYTGWFC